MDAFELELALSGVECIRWARFVRELREEVERIWWGGSHDDVMCWGVEDVGLNRGTGSIRCRFV